MIRFFSFILFTALCWPGLSRADFVELLASSDWSLSDETDPQLQIPTCRISTTKTTSADPIEFSLHFPKDNKFPPYISVKKKTAAGAMIGVKVSVTETQSLFLWKPSATPEESNIYWYAPVKFSALVELVKAKNELELIIDPKVNPQTIKVSLKGSSNAFNSIKGCKGVPEPKDFFALLNKEKENLVPDLGDRSVAVLVQSIQDAYESFQAGKEIGEALAKLRKPVEPLLKKERTALKIVADAKGKMDQALLKLDEANKQLGDLQSKIALGKSDLENLKNQKLAADQDLAAKFAIYKPLKDQMKPFEDRVEKADSAVDNIQSSISNKESIIVNNQARIRRLRNELADIQSSIPRVKSEVSNLEWDLSRAESNLNSYDISRETDKILDNDWSYRNLRSELESKRRDLSGAERDYNQAERRADRAKNQVRECRRATPPRDCSAEESEWSSADNERDHARNRYQSIQSDISSIQSRMGWAEDSARRTAQSEHDRLRSIRDSIASDVRDKRLVLISLFNRQSEIQAAIPRLQNEISDAENALPGLRRRLVVAQEELRIATQEKEQFARSIGFDGAERDYLAAKTMVNNLADAITKKTAEIAKLEKALPAALKLVDSRQKELTKTQTAYAATLPPLEKVQEQLKTFRLEEAKLLAELNLQGAKFKENQARFQDLVKYLNDNS